MSTFVTLWLLFINEGDFYVSQNYFGVQAEDSHEEKLIVYQIPVEPNVDVCRGQEMGAACTQGGWACFALSRR